MNITALKIKTLVLASAALLLGACATPIKSTIDQASNSDISAFRSYAWISDEPYTSANATRTELINPLNFRRVRESIEEELNRKGYVKAARSEADFVLGFTLGARDRVRVQHYYDNFGYRYFGSHSRFGFRPGIGITSSVRTFTEGTLAVDLFDNRTREAIWHGTATRSLSRDANGQDLITEAVAALIGPIPARPMMSANLRDVAPPRKAAM